MAIMKIQCQLSGHQEECICLQIHDCLFNGLLTWTGRPVLGILLISDVNTLSFCVYGESSNEIIQITPVDNNN